MREKGIEKLLQQLQDKDDWIRYSAVKTLGELGKKGGEVVPELIRTMKEDKSGAVRAWAAWALGKMDAEEAVAELEAVMKEDKDEVVYSAARWALKKIEKRRGKE